VRQIQKIVQKTTNAKNPDAQYPLATSYNTDNNPQTPISSHKIYLAHRVSAEVCDMSNLNTAALTYTVVHFHASLPIVHDKYISS